MNVLILTLGSFLKVDQHQIIFSVVPNVSIQIFRVLKRIIVLL